MFDVVANKFTFAISSPDEFLLLWSPCVADADIIVLTSDLYLSFFLASAVADWGCLPYFDTWCGSSANLECRSETCYTRLAGNAGRKKLPKMRHLGTIVQLCRAISSQLRHVSTNGKPVKQQYLPHMPLQYGELRSTSG